MKSNAAKKPYDVLQAENRQLRERLLQMDKQIKRLRPRTRLGREGADSRLFELVKQKDKELSEYSDRMEHKARELENLVKELNRRNEELANHMAVLRLYQLIFENEPNGILGFDREGLLIQFNAAAVRFFGVTLHACRLQHISKLQIPGAPDSELESLFDRSIDENREVSREVATGEGQIFLRCYRLDDAGGLRGVVMRVCRLEPAADAEPQ